MKGVKLTPNNAYLYKEEEQRPVGVQLFRGTMHQPAMVASVECQEDFKSAYNEFKTYEDYA